MQTLNRRGLLKAIGTGAAALAMPHATAAKEPTVRPNIVIVIADDIGYSDFGCYGSEIPTPNIDRLAAAGLRFTQFHTESMCAPTRSTLLTGRYYTRGYGKGDNVTIPEALKLVGYRSIAIGKWHNQGEDVLNRAAPQARGFDHFYGTPQGCGSFFAPLTLTRDGKPAEDDWRNNKDFYYTDAISDEAAAQIKSTPAEKPLFLYTAYTAAHWPLHAPPEEIAKHKGKYACGWDKLRTRRLARMKKLGVIKPDTPMSPRNPKVPAWADEPNKQWQQQRMEVYAAQITRMDTGIGKIVAALEATGRLDNTLIMFLVDNGACHVEYGPDRKGPFLNEQTRDGKPMRVGNLPKIVPGPEETWQSYGHGWANASNTPLRMFKQYDHEGGIRVPLIVQWPRVITVGGKITAQVAHIIDFLPTALDAAGVDYPKTVGDRRIGPADGTSMTPIFRGKQRKAHDALFWKFAHGRAARQGDWKLVEMDRNGWELYDLATDPAELTDLADRHPDKVAALEALWENWRATTTGRPKRRR